MEPNNPEAWHTIGVYYQDKVFKDKKLSRDVAKDYTLKGIAAEDKALSINPEYFEAMTYKNILMRQQALYERDPKVQKQLLDDAEKLLQRAMVIQKKQTDAADADKARQQGRGQLTPAAAQVTRGAPAGPALPFALSSSAGPQGLPMIRFEDLLEKVRAANPDADTELLRRAYVFSAAEHKGQVRRSGEPYLVHPLEVADLLADMRLDVVAIAAGLLHDIVEDTPNTIERVRELFGEQVAHVVEGVTKLSGLQFASSEERQAESFRKMLLAMVDDIRVILVKLADRLHNMRTLHHLPEDRRVRIAQETRDIYAPIAHRLGMSKLKNELEELAFRYIEPAAYNALRQQVETRRRATEGLVDELRKRLGQKLEEAQIPVVVLEGRIKRLWSIHQKLNRQHVALDQVYDFLALRVITRNVKDCYAVLGIIHQMWSPVPGRFKDFIAMSRPNGYQSLHTSVVSERGVPFEVQIRTEEMHRVAEEGIAAHWKYKEGRVGAERDEQYFHWLRQLVEWQQETRDPTEFMQNLRIELYAEEVYIFTPKGEVKSLPRGSTPVDFAYFIHTDVGPHVRRRAGQRAHGAAAHQARQRGHRRDPDADRAQAEPRLAEFRAHVPRAQQDQARDSCRGKDAQRGARPPALREGSAPVRRGEGPDRRCVRF